jgi:hypothetical protein
MQVKFFYGYNPFLFKIKISKLKEIFNILNYNSILYIGTEKSCEVFNFATWRLCAKLKLYLAKTQRRKEEIKNMNHNYEILNSFNAELD